MGISSKLSCQHTHHQIGFVENIHKSIVETSLSLLATTNAPLNLWEDAFDTAIFLLNKLP